MDTAGGRIVGDGLRGVSDGERQRATGVRGRGLVGDNRGRVELRLEGRGAVGPGKSCGLFRVVGTSLGSGRDGRGWEGRVRGLWWVWRRYERKRGGL